MALILCVPDDSDSEEEGSVASWDERFSEDTGSESGGSIVPMFIMSPPQSVAGSEMVTFEEFWGGPQQAQTNVEGEEEDNISLECVADDLKHLRPFFVYTLRTPLRSQPRTDLQFETLRVAFNDGKCWHLVLRVAEDPPEFKDAWDASTWAANRPIHPRVAVESEVLVVQAMKKAGVALVPNAHLPKKDAIICTDRESAHFYLEVMPGQQCPSNIFPPGPNARYLDNSIDPVSCKVVLESFIQSYADHQIQLSKVRFEKISQLEYSKDGEVIEGPILDSHHPVLDRRRIGPFTSFGAYHVARIDNLIYNFRHRNDEVWAFEERNEYLMLLECRKWIQMSKWLNKNRYDFYLRHTEDSLENYLMTDGELSGVLNWRGAYSSIKEEAFGSPSFMRGRPLSVTETLDAPLSAAESLLIKAYLSKGRSDLAGCVEGAKTYRALWKVPNSIADVKRFKELLQVDDDVQLPVCMYEWLSNLGRIDHRRDPGIIEDDRRAYVATLPGW